MTNAKKKLVFFIDRKEKYVLHLKKFIANVKNAIFTKKKNRRKNNKKCYYEKQKQHNLTNT